MTAPLVPNAPLNDFELLNNLLDYSAIHQAISTAASEKFSKHLWYLSEDLVALALFDDHVHVSTKRHILSAMREAEGTEDPPKRITVTLESFKEKKIEDFVTKKSMALFQLMELPDGFLQVDPEVWEDHEDFQTARATVRAINVVNDHAERRVALIQEFSGLLTKNEPQLQYLLQVVEEHRRVFPIVENRLWLRMGKVQGELNLVIVHAECCE